MDLKGQQPGFEIKQVNIVINSLGGYSKGLRENMRSIVREERGKQQAISALQDYIKFHARTISDHERRTMCLCFL